MKYYKIVSDDEETLAICMTGKRQPYEWRPVHNRIDRELGTGRWKWVKTTQAEFETLRAFGIKEITG